MWNMIAPFVATREVLAGLDLVGLHFASLAVCSRLGEFL
jgi:hypothetical protein